MLGALREITGDEKQALKGLVGANVVKFLETVQASNFLSWTDTKSLT